jgi:hypothetical protein
MLSYAETFLLLWGLAATVFGVFSHTAAKRLYADNVALLSQIRRINHSAAHTYFVLRKMSADMEANHGNNNQQDK